MVYAPSLSLLRSFIVFGVFSYSYFTPPGLFFK